MNPDVLELVKRANPIDQDRAIEWTESEAAVRIRSQIEDEGPRADRPWMDVATRSRRISVGLRVAGLAAALLLVGGGIAGAAAVLLGRPAPEGVKEHLRGVDAGLPADIRLNPDVENARSVAATEASTLYYAELRNGGYCTEIVTGHQPRGANCLTSIQVSTVPIEVTVPTSDPESSSTPVSIGGRVNVDGAATLAIVYADRAEDPIPFGEDHFFVFDVPGSRLASVHADGFELIARDASGSDVGRGVVPADFDQVASDDRQPIFVSTISDQSDLTKVLGVEGTVNVDGVASLELVYPDGTHVDIALRSDGSYRYDLPADRVDDLYQIPGELIARGTSGKVLAKARVAAVAYWRARERSDG
jgi:hypothetical protein